MFSVHASPFGGWPQVPDHFEWRYLVAMDLALATSYIGETRYRQSVLGQNMDQASALLDLHLLVTSACTYYPLEVS